MAAAFAGHVARTTAVLKRQPGAEAAAAAAARRPVGLKLSLRMAAFEIGLADALSELRGQDRLFFGALGGHVPETDGEAEPAVDASLHYWHRGGPHLGQEDELDAHFRLRAFSGMCLNPFRPEPECFLEPWGMDMEARSKRGDRTVVAHLVSDQHTVVNLTSSVLLAVKPTLQTLMPPSSVDPRRSTALSAGAQHLCASPLDQLLHSAGDLTRQDLLDHGLLREASSTIGGAELGTRSLDEAEVVQESGPAIRNRRPSGKVVDLSLPACVAVSRVILSRGWILEHVSGDVARGRLTLVVAPALGSAGDQHPPEVTLFARERRADMLPSVPARPRALGPRIGRRQMQVVNHSGLDGRLWFEGHEGAQEALKQLPDGAATVCSFAHVGSQSALCIGLDGGSEVLRPDLSAPGRYATPLGDAFSESLLGEGPVCLCTDFSIKERGAAMELLPPLELRNATNQELHVTLLPAQAAAKAAPSSRRALAVQTLALAPGEDFQVPLRAVLEPGWTVVTSGQVAHAFTLSRPLLQPGAEAQQLRRTLGVALETHTLPPMGGQGGASGSSRHQSWGGLFGFGGSGEAKLRRYTLLLLPGLRVVNALPFPLRLKMERHDTEPREPVELEAQPGVSTDFGLVSWGFRLSLAATGAAAAASASASAVEDYCLDVPQGVMHNRSKFLELNRDFGLGNHGCRLQCSWANVAGAELVICGNFAVFNKTGLPLRLRDAGRGPGRSLDIGTPCVAQVERQMVEVMVASGASAAAEPGGDRWPSHTDQLCLQMKSSSEDALFSWVRHLGVLADDALVLERDSTPTVRWRLSQHSTATSVEVLDAGSQHSFRLEDPDRAESLLLRATSGGALQAWLRHLGAAVRALRGRASADETRSGWDAEEAGPCRRAALPGALRGAWSKEIPVQAPGEGEVAVEVRDREGSPTYLFLGVQVRPLMGMLARSMGVTLTPRFVVQNRTKEFIQLLPTLLPPDQAAWPLPQHASLEAALLHSVANAAGGPLRENKALLASAADWPQCPVWVSPNESVALFHFPTWCSPKEAPYGRKAVALRLPGRAPLEVISMRTSGSLPLDLVGDGFMPYLNDTACRLGPLPQALRVLARDGRLLCLRGARQQPADRGDLCLTAESEVIVAAAVDEDGGSSLAVAWESLPGRAGAWERLPGRAHYSLCRVHLILFCTAYGVYHVLHITCYMLHMSYYIYIYIYIYYTICCRQPRAAGAPARRLLLPPLPPERRHRHAPPRRPARRRASGSLASRDFDDSPRFAWIRLVVSANLRNNYSVVMLLGGRWGDGSLPYSLQSFRQHCAERCRNSRLAKIPYRQRGALREVAARGLGGAPGRRDGAALEPVGDRESIESIDDCVISPLKLYPP